MRRRVVTRHYNGTFRHTAIHLFVSNCKRDSGMATLWYCVDFHLLHYFSIARNASDSVQTCLSSCCFEAQRIRFATFAGLPTFIEDNLNILFKDSNNIELALLRTSNQYHTKSKVLNQQICELFKTAYYSLSCGPERAHNISYSYVHASNAWSWKITAIQVLAKLGSSYTVKQSSVYTSTHSSRAEVCSLQDLSERAVLDSRE
eukprot:3998515-Amphidinium_carterae.1